MPRVKIVTDSSNGLPPEIVSKYDITVVPIQIQFGAESYKEGWDITREEFYRKLDEPVMPTTSQPSPGDFVNAYKSLVGTCDSIISIHLTSKGSGTCQAAKLAAEMIEGADITVVDTKTAGMGTGLIVIAAAEAALEGKGPEEIMKIIERGIQTTHIFVTLPTLKYLRRSGRVPQVQAMVATLLSIKPVLACRDGLVEAIERVRTFQSSARRVIELAAQACEGRAKRVVIMHSDALDQARALLEQLKEKISFEEVIYAEMSGSLVVHGGPGMLGVAVTQV
ncbi:MAG: DegV family protein [Firmicutes bacterium]|jgi:DegV family protein with EDD domain|nr:DegV family protein [Bacillota bacterium]